MTALVPLGAADAGEPLHRPADQVLDGMGAVERRVRVLEDDLDRLHRLARPPVDAGGDGRSVEADGAAGVVFDEAEHEIGERRLARAGLADEAERLPGRQGQRDVAQRIDAAVARQVVGLRQVLELQHRLGVRPAIERVDGRHLAHARQLVDPVVEMAAAAAAVADVVERRRVDAAALLDEAAARREDAALPDRARQRREAGNVVERRAALEAGPRQAAQEAGGIGMARVVEEFARRAFLDELAGVEHADAAAQRGDGGEIVADEQDRGAELLAQRVDEVEHLGLDRRVEAGGRLVEDEQGRVLRQRHGDDDALLHAAGQLVRKARHDARGVGDAHAAEHLLAAPIGFAAGRAEDLEHLRHLPADGERRVQRLAGVLEDHGDVPRAHLPQRGGAELHRIVAGDAGMAAGDAPVRRQHALEGERDGRLAGAGFADEAIGFAAGDRQRDVGQDRQVAAAHGVGDAEIVEFEGRGGGRAVVSVSLIRRPPAAGLRRRD